MNTTLPYKFGLVLPKLEGIFQWNRFYFVSNDVCMDAKLGTIMSGGIKTYRIDVGYEYFKQDSSHWKNKDIKDFIKSAFANFNFKYLKKGSVITMVWTNDLSWLADTTVKQVFERWHGNAEEPQSVWARVRASGVARHQGNAGEHDQ